MVGDLVDGVVHFFVSISPLTGSILV